MRLCGTTQRVDQAFYTQACQGPGEDPSRRILSYFHYLYLADTWYMFMHSIAGFGEVGRPN